ncbi:MAG: nucleotide exchange factor GrpE [Clostridia bacterium]|nr:nucleotide exchange factor GrpE [Clostridia bacterium]
MMSDELKRDEGVEIPIEDATEEEMETEAAEAEETEAESAEAEAEAEDAETEAEDAETEEEAPEEAPAASPAEESDAKYLRLLADFQNFKRRTEKEKKDIYSFANEKMALPILEVLDNFERALAQGTSDEKYAEGMQMIFKQLTDALKKSGLEEIEALAQDFDPNFHNAVFMEDTDQYESGKVSGVIQKGYSLNGKVIRPAMVKVAK